MAITSNTYTGNGSNKLFSITFPYLETTDVDVYLNGTLQTITTQYTFANATTIEFVAAPANGAVVLLDRSTDDAALQATFFPGSSIKAADLNADFDQTLYVVQEINNKAVKLNDPLYANKTYIDAQDATKVNKSGDTMSGALAMGTNKVTGLGNPTNAQDATTKTYVDTADALKVNKAGDTMTGNLAMGNNKVTGLGAPSANADAVTKSYVDGYINTTYLGPLASDPSTRPGGAALQVGDQYFNTTQNIVKAWTGTVWVISAAAGNIVRWRKTASAGNTTLSGVDDLGVTLSYVVGNEQVYLNGALQTRGVDYTAGTGTSITLTPALLAGDVVELHAVQGYVSATITPGSINDALVAPAAGIQYSKLALSNSITSADLVDGTIVNADVNASAGITAGKLSFTQSGTGAAARTVDSKLKDIISVKDFGATGNGSTDDTAAIQAAINAARLTNAVVYFPPNNISQFYKITAPLTCDGPISIIGAGPQAVTIWAQGFTAGQYILDFDLPVATNYFFDIKGITLRSNNQAPNGIRLKNTSYCTLSNVQLYNVANGVVITGAACFSNYFENLACYLVSARSVLFQSFTGGGHYTFNHCTFTGNYGFEVDSASAINELTFTSCNFEQCVTNSFSSIGTVQGLSFVGCRTEGLDGTADFLLYPSAGNEVTGLSVTGCYFTTDAGASVPIYLGGNSGAVRGFNICGNHVEYAAANNFVTLNGDGESGVIAGNYFNLTTTTPTNVRRPGVVIYANENATGKCVESWGNATWGVEEGTFTPSWIGTTVAGDTTPRYNVGRYTRNGNTVTVWIWGDYLLNSYTTKPTGQVRINNLPFVATSSPSIMYYEFPITSARITHLLPIFGSIAAGTNYILLYEEAANLASSPAAVDWTSVRDSFGTFTLQFSYRI